MEEELKIFVKVWGSAIISVSYCYCIPSKIKTGVFRLVSVLPVCALFLLLPLFFSFSSFSSTAAFCLSTVANLKLILFAFDQGPLYPLPSNLFQFICFTCFPIMKLQHNPKSHYRFPKWFFALKLVIFGLVLTVCSYKKYLHPMLLLGLYPLHLYLVLEISLTLHNNLFTIMLGCELDPHFNEPYLATSLQDFWGRRWNLIVPGIVRPGIYIPVRRFCYLRGMDSVTSMLLGRLVTFIVSGLVHELVYFYVTREMPTWEVTLFFVLNGVCMAVEVAVKRTAFVRRWWHVRPVVSRLLTVGFLVLTSGWLFFPQFIRSSVMEKRSHEWSLLFDLLERRFS